MIESDPNHWADGVSNCKGEHQSPVDINSIQSIPANVPRMSFFNYDKVFPETITNNGHTGRHRTLKICIFCYFALIVVVINRLIQ